MNVTITQAAEQDLETILKLQYLSFQKEARTWNNYQIPPLTETMAELQQEFARGPVLKAVLDDGTIVGSIRGYVEDGSLHLMKLMVHPDFWKQGIGSRLIAALEGMHPGLRYTLFTSCRSVDNLRLYEKLGYRRFREEMVTDTFIFIHLEK
jgi:GNAT superfamily N-acetyltransferase